MGQWHQEASGRRVLPPLLGPQIRVFTQELWPSERSTTTSLYTKQHPWAPPPLVQKHEAFIWTPSPLTPPRGTQAKSQRRPDHVIQIWAPPPPSKEHAPGPPTSAPLPTHTTNKYSDYVNHVACRRAAWHPAIWSHRIGSIHLYGNQATTTQSKRTLPYRKNGES